MGRLSPVIRKSVRFRVARYTSKGIISECAVIQAESCLGCIWPLAHDGWRGGRLVAAHVQSEKRPGVTNRASK